MLIPELMPDELARGYLARFKACNGYPSIDKAAQALRSRYGGNEENSPIPMPYVLARATGLNSEVFCQHHTMLPYLRAVTNLMPEVANGAQGATQTMSKSMSTPEGCARWCGSCVQEDIDFWGYAYYRRSHQLPGVLCCSKHQELLLSTPSRLPFDEHPGSRPALTVDQQLEPKILDHPLISRFTTIVETWLSEPIPIALDVILIILDERVRAVGNPRGWKGNRTLLSNLALDICPRPWLKALVSNKTRSQRNVFLNPLDNIFTSRSSAIRSAYY